MNATPRLRRFIHVLPLPLALLFCSGPLVAISPVRRDKPHFEETAAREMDIAPSLHLQTRDQLPPRSLTVSKDYVGQQLEWLKTEDPRHLPAHIYFESLIAAGYDPTILDGWLDALQDGMIVAGMPAELVRSYCGEPLSCEAVSFEGAPASEWSVRLLPNRVEKVTVSHDTVVRVQPSQTVTRAHA